MNWKSGITLIVLAINTGTDIRTRKINLPVTLVYLAAGFLLWIKEAYCSGIENWLVWSMALVPGIFLCFCSGVSRGNIGMGDAILFLGLGFWHGFELSLTVLLAALGIASLYGGYLVLVQKVGRKRQIPFLPFMLAGMIGGILL
ncbi:MAG: prepilin peptidase [Lachnospiraceae bacterium]|nr:prepilin peptidase [Lachnospiraceae bacterium]